MKIIKRPKNVRYPCLLMFGSYVILYLTFGFLGSIFTLKKNMNRAFYNY